MPYQDPGALSKDEYWAVTAYLADQQFADARGEVLNGRNALSVILP